MPRYQRRSTAWQCRVLKRALKLGRSCLRRAAPGLLALTFWLCVCQPCGATESIVLFNGNVYTADERNPRADAVVAVAGRIVYVGTNAEA